MDITLKILDHFGYLHFTAVIFRYSYLKKIIIKKKKIYYQDTKRGKAGEVVSYGVARAIRVVNLSFRTHQLAGKIRSEIQDLGAVV